MAKVRKYAEQLPLEDAVERAVTECIRENILADFLKKNRAEVVAMSIFEYDKVEEEKQIIKQNSKTFSFQNPCGILREKVFLSV